MPRPQKDATERYFRGEVAHQTSLRRYSSGLGLTAARIIEEHDRSLSRILRRRLPSIVGRPFDLRDERWRRLVSDIQKNRRRAIGKVKDMLRQQVIDLSQQEVDQERDLLLAALSPLLFDFERPTAAALRAAILGIPYGGSDGGGRTLRQWFETAFKQSSSRVIDVLQRGVSEGASVSKLVAQIIGTKKLKFTDGATAQLRRSMVTVVDTTVTHVSGVSRALSWSLNGSVISHLQWTAILDNRTSAICQGRDGKNAPVDDGGSAPSPLLVPSNARPPAHPNCRSVMMPVFKFGGAIPKQNYQEWLTGMSPQFQDSVLGPARGALFRTGGLPLDKFVSERGTELTLPQLARQNPQAFSEANISTEDL